MISVEKRQFESMIAAHQIRAWISSRQGLSGPRIGGPRQALVRSGWSRSVGGANPYLAIRARTGASREDIDTLASDLELFELPSARGCTYVVPRDHFTLALLAGEKFRSVELQMAKRHLSVTDEEIDRLSDKVLDSLRHGALEPSEIKERVGSQVRNLGEAGKKRGTGSTLPLALSRLQSQGLIRRQPVNSRLDTQKYRYELWQDSPLRGSQPDPELVFAELAKLYFGWIGVASVANFAWFAGLSLRESKKAVDSLRLREVPDCDHLISEEDWDSLWNFKPPTEPQYRLTGSIDNLFHLRRDISTLLDESDLGQTMGGERGTVELRTVSDLNHHAILDRGRLIGFWDFDPEANKVRWKSFASPDSALRAEVAKTEAFVREQLGDARTFSLDSPQSRRKRLSVLPL